MIEEYKEAILKIWEMHQHIKPEFSCTLCKAKVNPQLVKDALCMLLFLIQIDYEQT